MRLSSSAQSFRMRLVGKTVLHVEVIALDRMEREEVQPGQARSYLQLELDLRLGPDHKNKHEYQYNRSYHQTCPLDSVLEAKLHPNEFRSFVFRSRKRAIPQPGFE
jgi:hypothetical protein